MEWWRVILAAPTTRMTTRATAFPWDSGGDGGEGKGARGACVGFEGVVVRTAQREGCARRASRARWGERGGRAHGAACSLAGVAG